MVLCATAAFAIVAVPLAMLGAFGAVTVCASTTIVAGCLAIWAWPHPIELDAPPSATLVTLAGIAVVTLLGLAFPTQHFTTNRDPGVYSSVGLWMSAEGNLLVDGVPAELNDIDGVAAAGNGFYDTRDDGKLYAQFSHLTGALLGSAHALGGPAAMVRTNAVIGAAALVALYLAGTRLSSAWPAAIAVQAVAWSLPQIYFTRGPYSEPLTQLLLIGSLALLLSAARLKPAHAALAGLLLGGVVGSRIDGVLIVVAAVALVIYLALVRDQEPGTSASLLALVGGGALTTAIGVADLALFSPVYLSHLWPQFRQAMLAALALTVVGAILLAARPLRQLVANQAKTHTSTISIAAGVLTSTILGLLLLVRPHVQEVRGRLIELVQGLQGRQGLDVDGTRYYFEDSLLWFTWYLGWPLVVSGIVGAGIAMWRVVAKQDWLCGVTLILTGLPTLVYLWRPTITPDQIWAMRRFLPFGFPWIALTAAIALDAGRSVASRNRGRIALSAYYSVAAALVVVPALFVSHAYIDHREHRLTYGALDELCVLIDGDLTLVDDRDDLGVNLVQPLTAGCGAPVARADLSDATLVGTASDRATETGKRLVLVTSRPDDVGASVGERGAVPLVLQEIERSIERPPNGLEPNPDTNFLHVLAVD